MRNLFLCGGCLVFMAAVVNAEEVVEAKVGKPAPDFTVTGIDGQPLKLSQLTAKGKNVVLLFDRAHW